MHDGSAIRGPVTMVSPLQTPHPKLSTLVVSTSSSCKQIGGLGMEVTVFLCNLLGLQKVKLHKTFLIWKKCAHPHSPADRNQCTLVGSSPLVPTGLPSDHLGRHLHCHNHSLRAFQ